MLKNLINKKYWLRIQQIIFNLKKQHWWIRKKPFHRLGAFFEGPKACFAALRAFSKKCQCAHLMTSYELIKIDFLQFHQNLSSQILHLKSSWDAEEASQAGSEDDFGWRNIGIFRCQNRSEQRRLWSWFQVVIDFKCIIWVYIGF